MTHVVATPTHDSVRNENILTISRKFTQPGCTLSLFCPYLKVDEHQ